MAILIVDDTPATCLLLRAMLRKAGYEEIYTATSAREALAHLGLGTQPAPADFQLVLLDMVMPEMDGLECCRIIRRHDATRELPVIIVTARDDRAALSAAFEAGAFDYISKPIDPTNLHVRVRNALRLKAALDEGKARELELIRSQEALEEANRRLAVLATTDALTGAANRRQLEVCLEREWERALRYGRSLAVVLIDIDHFKGYNDHYGHLAGDRCLQQVTETLQQGAARSTELFGRYGGEEFLLVLPEISAQEAAQNAERLRIAVEARNVPHELSPVAPYLTVSLGVSAVVPSRGTTVTQLLRAADRALYSAKAAGRNCVRCADPE